MEDFYTGTETPEAFKARRQNPPQDTQEWLKWSEENDRLDKITLAEWKTRDAARREKSDRAWEGQSAQIRAFNERVETAMQPRPKSAFDNGDVIDLEQQPDGTFS